MDTRGERPAEQTDECPRRSYERPAILWEEDFAPYAFSGCGKMPSQGGVCMTMSSS
jgi:hypothetical protein